jgi:hypothetical protein
VQIQYINTLVGTITEKQLMFAILDIQFGNYSGHMLGHSVIEFHLNQLSQFSAFVPHNKFGNGLVPSVR